MKFVDIPDASKITGDPVNRTTIISDGKIQQDGVEIIKIELLQYKIKSEEKLGDYSVITALIQTDLGEIEILYDEGYRGKNALQDSANMLTQNLGLSGLILRSLISLKNHIEKNWEAKTIIIN